VYPTSSVAAATPSPKGKAGMATTPPKPSPLGKVPKADEVGSASVKIKKHEPKRKPPIQTKQHGSDRAEGFQRAIANFICFHALWCARRRIPPA
ncbi:MAG: hypothetical protein ACLT74_06585, partial [Christensenellales bacterium]